MIKALSSSGTWRERPALIGALLVIGCTLGTLMIVYASLVKPLVGPALIYVTFFVALAWKRADIALMLIFVGAPFQQNLADDGRADQDQAVHFSIAEANLALAVPVVLYKAMRLRRRISMGPLAIPMALHFAVCVLVMILYWQPGGITADHNRTAFTAIAQMSTYLVFAVLVFALLPDRLEQLFLSLEVLVWVGVLLAAIGHAIGLTKNGLGGSLAAALIVATELWFAATEPKRRRLLALAMAAITASLLFTLSRGAWAGAITGIAVIAVLRRRVALLVRVACLAAPVIVICWMVLPQESRDYALGFTADHQNIKLRYDSLHLAQSLWETSPIYGVGVNLRKEFDATNIFWLTLAETGIIGLVTFTTIHVVIYRTIWRTRQWVSTGEPAFSLLAIAGGLITCKLSHGMVDHYWSRGNIMSAWAAVGMMLAAYFVARRRSTEGAAVEVVDGERR